MFIAQGLLGALSPFDNENADAAIVKAEAADLSGLEKFSADPDAARLVDAFAFVKRWF
jgi:hypothetical protein